MELGTLLKQLRRDKGVNQEALAAHLDISIQAVSKWECDASYPDITLLPKIAQYFGVTIDYLLTGKHTEPAPPEQPEAMYVLDALPNDNKLRIVQCRGNQIVQKDMYSPNIRIRLALPKRQVEPYGGIEIWGSADIQGDVSGGVHAGDSVACLQVSGGVHAGDSVTCTGVSGGVHAGDTVTCASISGGLNCGGNVNCAGVSGGIQSADRVKCENVVGNIRCDGTVYCKEVSGDIDAKEIIKKRWW